MSRDVYESKVNFERIKMIIKAINRYSEVDKPIPIEWIIELEERLDEL